MPHDSNVTRSCNAETDAISSDFQHGDFNVVADANRLVLFAGQDKHHRLLHEWWRSRARSPRYSQPVSGFEPAACNFCKSNADTQNSSKLAQRAASIGGILQQSDLQSTTERIQEVRQNPLTFPHHRNANCRLCCRASRHSELAWSKRFTR